MLNFFARKIYDLAGLSYRLPKDFTMEPTNIGHGYVVMVYPSEKPPGKRSTGMHRVHLICHCGKVVSVGRWDQHQSVHR